MGGLGDEDDQHGSLVPAQHLSSPSGRILHHGSLAIGLSVHLCRCILRDRV